MVDEADERGPWSRSEICVVTAPAGLVAYTRWDDAPLPVLAIATTSRSISAPMRVDVWWAKKKDGTSTRKETWIEHEAVEEDMDNSPVWLLLPVDGYDGMPWLLLGEYVFWNKENAAASLLEATKKEEAEAGLAKRQAEKAATP